MDSLKHSILLTDIGASGSTNTALKLCRFVGDDITVEVGKKEHLEVASALFINKLCGHNVCIPLVGGDLGIEIGNLVAVLKEVSVGRLYNVRFGNE